MGGLQIPLSLCPRQVSYWVCWYCEAMGVVVAKCHKHHGIHSLTVLGPGVGDPVLPGLAPSGSAEGESVRVLLPASGGSNNLCHSLGYGRRPGSPPHCHTATSLCVSPGLHVAFLRGHLSLGLGTTMLQVTDDIAKTSLLNKVPL